MSAHTTHTANRVSFDVPEEVVVAAMHAQDAVVILNRHHPQGHLYRQAASDVLAERQRQIDEEGYTPEHDDGHKLGQLAHAAACYATAGQRWPRSSVLSWDPKGYNPSKDRRQNLAKAGALILAEIERLDRAEQARQEGAA